jgi:CRISPR-associated endoribonuclease Cas6
MRFRITLSRADHNRNTIPINYQYFLSAWIYNIINLSDKDYGQFLHSTGYTSGNKKFKYFNFSPLKIQKFNILRQDALLEIWDNTLSFELSFYIEQSAEHFIIGLFQNQKVFIGDRLHGMNFTVQQIEKLPDANISQTQSYRALSPIVISYRTRDSKYAQYLSPEISEYSNLFINNIIEKYFTLHNEQNKPDIQMRITSKPYSKLITIKPNTPFETKIRGYVYNFELTAPDYIHQLLYHVGAGEKNSMGFGWVEVKNN